MLRRISAAVVAVLSLVVLFSGCSPQDRVAQAVEAWLAKRSDISQVEVSANHPLLQSADVTVSGQVADAAAAEAFIADFREPEFSRDNSVPIYVALAWPAGPDTVHLHSTLYKPDVAGLWTLASQV